MHLLALFFPPVFGFGFILYFLPAILAFARRRAYGQAATVGCVSRFSGIGRK